MLIGTVEQIWRYPVKSMAGERLTECSVGNLGVFGDRGWALRDESTRLITTGTRIPLLMQCAAVYDQPPGDNEIPNVEITFPDGSSVKSEDETVNARLSQVLGKSVTLRPREPLSTPPPAKPQFTSPHGTYFDCFTIHVLTSASLATMAKLNPAADWDVRRFRPNFFVRTTADIEGLPDADWNGRVLRIGNVEVHCEIATLRCAMTINQQKDVPKDSSILRTIVNEANQDLGSYSSVIKTGRVVEGDVVELI